jgi:hypothetical protein
VAWHDTLLTDAGPAITTGGREPSYSGGVSLDHSDPTTAYLSRRVGDHNVVERWVTADGGLTFTSAAVEQDLSVDNLRPVVPLGLAKDDRVRALWMAGSYRYFTDYRTYVSGPPALPMTPETMTVRLAPTPATVIERRPVKLTARVFSPTSGHVAVGAEVTLFERRARGLVWSRVGTARTDSAGLVSFRYTITRDTELMIDWPGDERWGPAQNAPRRITAAPPPYRG